MGYTPVLLIACLAIFTCVRGDAPGKTASMHVASDTKLNCRSLNPNISVTMTIEGHEQKLTYTKNNGRVNINCPIYAIKDGVIQEENVLDVKNEDVYLDRPNKSFMKITCLELHNREPMAVFWGVVSFKGKEWVMTSEKDPDFSAPIRYSLREAERPIFTTDSTKSAESTVTTTKPLTAKPYNNPVPSQRRKRATVQAYNVDILAVIDYSIYSHYFTQSSQATDELKKAEALVNIKKYFAHIFNGVTLRYDDTGMNPPIVVRLVGYYVAETTGTDYWTESIKVYQSSTQTFTVNAVTAIEKLKSWRASTSGLPQNDHVMLFTRYNLLTVAANGSVNTGVVGYAFVGSTCSEKSVSLIEESYDRFEGTSATAAHELGHNLGAKHDGTDNLCWRDERFLMWPSLTTVNTYHIWYFSTCSIEYFEQFLGKLVQETDGYTCMNSYTSAPDVPNVSATRQGQELSFAEQCAVGLGASSVVCKGITSLSTLCGLMYCTIPSRQGFCQAMYPALGTHCGAKSWCQGGQCVETTNPAVPADRCPFEETATSVGGSGMNCSAYVKEFGARSCYITSVINECCKSCDVHYTGISGCEYGNKISLCKAQYCDPEQNHTFSDGVLYQVKCCRTCNYTTDVTNSTDGNLWINYSGTYSWYMDPASNYVVIVTVVVYEILSLLNLSYTRTR